jgi:hypothetical protein
MAGKEKVAETDIQIPAKQQSEVNLSSCSNADSRESHAVQANGVDKEGSA